jgi:hypothetical protein
VPGQAGEIIDHSPTFDPGAADDERDAGAEGVEVALAIGKSRRAVIAADHDEGVLILPCLAQLIDQSTNGTIEGHHLS